MHIIGLHALCLFLVFLAVPSTIAFVGRPWIGHMWPDVGKVVSLHHHFHHTNLYEKMLLQGGMH